jgi:hypothetical protein
MVVHRFRDYLARSSPIAFVFVAGVAAFAAYAGVYAFRKPFTAASFEGMEFWGVQYKIALVIAQVAGYSLSKFLGIGFIGSLRHERRLFSFILLIGIAMLSLLGFALSPPSWGPVWFFLNGLPLGLGWGLVFSYLEGRRTTEVLAAMLCVNFIISSGFVKTMGRWLLDTQGIKEHWMPLVVAAFFVPFLAISIWILEQLPPPTASDIEARSERRVMGRRKRRRLFRKYALGLIVLIVIYLLLTLVRDVRDNFAVELWRELGFAGQASILTTAELPIALFTLVGVAMLGLIRDNRKALWAYHLIFMGGATVTFVSTVMFQNDALSPFLWMMLSGSGIILPYILFNGVIFDRLLAAFREKGNVGYLMYMADAFGYLGSVAILLLRNFGYANMTWLGFFVQLCLWGAGLAFCLSAVSWGYFMKKAYQK